jgi:hypothetical protein
VFCRGARMNMFPSLKFAQPCCSASIEMTLGNYDFACSKNVEAIYESHFVLQAWAVNLVCCKMAKCRIHEYGAWNKSKDSQAR